MWSASRIGSRPQAAAGTFSSGPGAYAGGAGNAYAGDETEIPDDIDALVTKIKELQRNDQSAKESWISYVAMNGGGTRDPSKHDASFLQAFLTQLGSGGVAGAESSDATLHDAIKMMQKRSSTFKQVWASFCASQGGGKNDPAKHDPSFHVKFFEHMASQTSMTLGMLGDGAPLKRMRSGGGSPKELLVNRLKSFQRMGATQKDLWGNYADTYLQGLRDPSRHDAETLREFCDNHGVPDTEGGGGGGGGPGMGMAQGMGMALMGGRIGGGGGGGGMGSEKADLVERVKSFQKSERENAEAWWAFSGSARDPARHDVAKLKEFCTVHGI